MNHLGLFEGIGGFSLAARWMGWDTIAWCEINPFCQRVLKYHFPNTEGHGDIKETDFTIYRGRVDILTGGFPCQPYSTAGRRLGKEDERHLWPQMLRAIREIQPRYIVGENVRGLTNWNGGLVFDEVQAELEAEGYEVLPFLLPACGIDAPHRRDRIWFIAHAHSNVYAGRLDNGRNRSEASGSEAENKQQAGRDENRERVWAKLGASGSNDTNAGSIRQQGQGRAINAIRSTKDGDWKASWAFDDGRWPTQPPVCNGNDGLPAKLDAITLLDWREGSLSGGGNAIVPQLALRIFQAIEQYDLST